jgi:hypothetical protein
MKAEDKNILEALLEKNDFGKSFSLPEGYFEGLHARVMEQVDQQPVQEEIQAPSMWERVRPLFYMAAMFVSLFLLIKFVVGGESLGKSTLAGANYPDEELYQDYYLSNMDEYTIYEQYQSSQEPKVEIHTTSY